MIDVTVYSLRKVIEYSKLYSYLGALFCFRDLLPWPDVIILNMTISPFVLSPFFNIDHTATIILPYEYYDLSELECSSRKKAFKTISNSKMKIQFEFELENIECFVLCLGQKVIVQ